MSGGVLHKCWGKNIVFVVGCWIEAAELSLLGRTLIQIGFGWLVEWQFKRYILGITINGCRSKFFDVKYFMSTTSKKVRACIYIQKISFEINTA